MPLGDDMQQFLQLCKKNFIVKARNKRATILELGASLYFLIIVVVVVKLLQNQLSFYPELPALPLAAPTPLGSSPGPPLALPLTCLYSKSSTACASKLAQDASWYQHCHP